MATGDFKPSSVVQVYCDVASGKLTPEQGADMLMATRKSPWWKIAFVVLKSVLLGPIST